MDQTTVNIFLSSPTEVEEERQAVIDAVAEIRNAGNFKVSLVYWEDTSSGVPLDANRAPQATIEEGRLSPNQCQIVIGIFDRKFGSPPGNEFTKLDGTPFQSGTEFELDQAFDGFSDRGFPSIVIYRRERPDGEVEALLKNYISKLKLPSGTSRGIQAYADSCSFRQRIKKDLEGKIEEVLSTCLLYTSDAADE